MMVFGLFVTIPLILAEPPVATDSTEPNKATHMFELVNVTKIWDKGEHNAFTGLARFRDTWYCAFREARTHVCRDGTDNGNIRILKSSDGVEWTSAALFSWDGGDLRDAQLSITPDNQLMVNASVAFYPVSEKKPRRSLTWLSADGKEFTGPHACETGIDTWRWSVAWHNQYGYSIGYSGKDMGGCLYRTQDGITWEIVKDDLFPFGTDKFYNEASILFDDDGTMLVLLRGDPHDALFGRSRSPYTEWVWEPLDKRIGGPRLHQLPDKRIIAVVRLYEPARTALCMPNLKDGTLDEIMVLPSGGDTSYAGTVWHDEKLWISYYSSHEGKSAIYLALVAPRHAGLRRSRDGKTATGGKGEQGKR